MRKVSTIVHLYAVCKHYDCTKVALPLELGLQMKNFISLLLKLVEVKKYYLVNNPFNAVWAMKKPLFTTEMILFSWTVPLKGGGPQDEGRQDRQRGGQVWPQGRPRNVSIFVFWLILYLSKQDFFVSYQLCISTWKPACKYISEHFSGTTKLKNCVNYTIFSLYF